MASFSKSNSNYRIRSISLPCRLHPSIVRIEEELNKLKSWEASPPPNGERICDALNGLGELYMSMDDFLKLTLTQQALSLHQQEEWIDGLLDGSLRLLDVCGIIRDLMSQLKEHVRDLQSTLRRRKDDSSTKISISKFLSFRKDIKKNAKKLIATMKQIEKRTGGSLLLGLDHHFSSVIRVLREAVVATTSIFHLLLLFLFVPTKRSLVSRLLHTETVAYEGQRVNMNELESANFALHALWKCGSSEGDWKLLAQNRLEYLETSIEAIENCLGLSFRSMIRARASLLNVVSL
ncbi:uncharacterized protein LOC130778024 [Actinidia eriantha]|uniref:uncharacterized protein LOC130778024 n=1 Tax=Actinidia eriantha TaxID=165200 RepID=UPI00258DD90B|nr:uncharacterized protein LOC130778024 [Actinidia eriantha]